jgi:hypothetical protein
MPTGIDGLVIYKLFPDDIIMTDIGATGLAVLLRSSLAKFVQFASLTWRRAPT